MKKTLMKINVEEMSEIHVENMFYPYFCTGSSRSVNDSPMGIPLVNVNLSTCILTRFISCNSDNSVQTVIIIGSKCIL